MKIKRINQEDRLYSFDIHFELSKRELEILRLITTMFVTIPDYLRESTAIKQNEKQIATNILNNLGREIPLP